MSSVFISYSPEDRPAARRIAADLKDRGIRVWLDEYEILPGDSIADKISQGIRTSEYLIVIISRNSVGSTWVRREVESAFKRNPEVSERRLIPVRIDDAPVPPYLAAIHYLDLRPDYAAAIERLARAVSQPPHPNTPTVSALIDAEELASLLAVEQGTFRGAGYLVTTALGILTIVVAVLSAIPSFQQQFGNQPRVYYSVLVDRLAFPSTIDGERIRSLLKENAIPDSTARIGIVNKGDAPAKIVKVGIKVPGIIGTVQSAPPPEPEPIWVRISVDHDPEEAPSYARYTLKELVPDHPLEAFVGFYGEGSQSPPDIDVVADGRPAERLSSLGLAPEWSAWRAFELPVKILGWGLGITLAIGLIVVVAANARTREAALLIVKELNPTLARLVDVLLRIAR